MGEKKTITEKLIAVQSELKAPKSQTNTFGKYKYRSCEDILEAVKPLLKKNGLFLGITDEIVLIGGELGMGRYYVKSTAKIADNDSCVEVSALAREPEEKKGMDDAQLTGATSSYARKYALNGLFLIDDTKDTDTMDNSSAGETTTTKKETATKTANKPAGTGTAAQRSVGATGKRAPVKQTTIEKKKPNPKSDSMMEQRAAMMSESFQQATDVSQLQGLAKKYKPEINLMTGEWQLWLRDEYKSNKDTLVLAAKQAEEGEEDL